MSFLLDTNICSAHLRRPSGLSHRFMQHSGRMFVSTIVLAELYAWAYRRDDPTPLLTAIETMLRLEVGVLPFDEACAAEFGRVQGLLRRLGTHAPVVDLMIASVALVHNHTMVTNDISDFSGIPGLRLEDWLTP